MANWYGSSGGPGDPTPPPSGNSGWENTVTNLGQGPGPYDPPLPPPAVPAPPAQSGSPSWWNSGNQAAGAPMTRLGPGVPSGTTAGPGTPTAEQIWRQGLPGLAPDRKPARRTAISTAISVILLIAAAVVIFLRLHHPAFGVNGVAITGHTQQGCTVSVTGRVDTTGGAGTVSYEWVFQPQISAPQALSQSVSAGQTAVYVTASVVGNGHGSRSQTVTLRVLGPGQARATSTNLTISC